jgi:glycosyltransferase involved in cell wall biosynthesis
MSSEGRQPASRRVALVAEELLGYVRNGLGTTTTFVAVALARLGHAVDVLYLGPTPTGPIDPEWQRLYDEAGIRVREVPRRPERVEPAHFARMRDVEAALREDPPEIVVVQDLGAPGYVALRLRRLGLAFERTAFVVLCHGTRQWITDVSRKVRVLPGAHAITVLERASIELADVVVSPSAYLLEWMRDQGWKLPPQTRVIPHVSRSGALSEPPPVRGTGKADRVERIAFFGRLEDRKGIQPFLGALNLLEPELLERVDVEFIGRPTPLWPVERVRNVLSERTRSTLRALSFETTLDQHEAIARLSRPGTLAVMPSFAEAFGNTVRECIEHGIPFIASNAAAIRELVAREDHARVLCDPTADGIAETLRRALLDAEVLRPAHSAFDDAESLRRWDEVLALPIQPPPPAGTIIDATQPGWTLLQGDDEVPDPELLETLVRAQQASGADVVTCGVVVDGTSHFFPGEPAALGLLGNGYGTVALVRSSLLDSDATDERWPLLAKLSLAGAKIVSVPLPLVTSTTAPAALDSQPAEALRVMGDFERALPSNQHFLAEFVTRAAAHTPQPSEPRVRGLARRVVRRLVRGLAR